MPPPKAEPHDAESRAIAGAMTWRLIYGAGSENQARDVPGSWFLVPGSWFLVPGSWFLVLRSQELALILQFRVFGFLSPDSGHRVGHPAEQAGRLLPINFLHTNEPRTRNKEPPTFNLPGSQTDRQWGRHDATNGTRASRRCWLAVILTAERSCWRDASNPAQPGRLCSVPQRAPPSRRISSALPALNSRVVLRQGHWNGLRRGTQDNTRGRVCSDHRQTVRGGGTTPQVEHGRPAGAGWRSS